MDDPVTQLNVKIRDRNSVLYDGTAVAVTSKNDTGIFDILPQHANFISILKDSITIHQQGEKDKTFDIGKGLLKVNNNNVDIFLEIGSSSPL